MYRGGGAGAKFSSRPGGNDFALIETLTGCGITLGGKVLQDKAKGKEIGDLILKTKSSQKLKRGGKNAYGTEVEHPRKKR